MSEDDYYVEGTYTGGPGECPTNWPTKEEDCDCCLSVLQFELPPHDRYACSFTAPSFGEYVEVVNNRSGIVSACLNYANSINHFTYCFEAMVYSHDAVIYNDDGSIFGVDGYPLYQVTYTEDEAGWPRWKVEEA